MLVYLRDLLSHFTSFKWKWLRVATVLGDAVLEYEVEATWKPRGGSTISQSLLKGEIL